MAKNLFEDYKGRLAVSEKYFGDRNDGAKMGNAKKILTAQCLDNVANYLNEAFTMTAGTQRADLGAFKLFCMDITTLTMPNLIVNDLFIVQPMSSFQGYLTYMEYSLSPAKGGVADGTVVQNPFVWAPMTEARMQYTGEAIVEKIDATGGITFAWGPVVYGKAEDIRVEVNGAYVPVPADRLVKDASGKVIGIAAGYMAEGTKVAYRYDNQLIPQEKLPGMRGQMKGIALTAKARRIGIEYSQFAAFQAKQDYGMDFEATIAQQAQAELEYEIDSEAVFMIKNAADASAPVVTWVDEELDTISYSMKAEGFARAIERAKAHVYKATGRFMPNWMLVSPDMMTILPFVPGFVHANNAIANGPYVAGNVAGMKVIVSPALGNKVCYLGVLGADGKSAVGVYAPYMPIVPTQLLGFADGTMSQGFSSLYDMKILNEKLLAKINVVEGDEAARVFLVEGSEA